MRRASPLLLAILLLAGCGGASNDQRLTREQFAAKADAICANYKQKTQAALSRPATLSALADLADQVLPLLHNARRELRRLQPPQSEQATANAWLDEFDASIGDVQKIRDAARKNDRAALQQAAQPALQHNQHANDLATRLGMTICNKG